MYWPKVAEEYGSIDFHLRAPLFKICQNVLFFLILQLNWFSIIKNDKLSFKKDTWEHNYFETTNQRLPPLQLHLLL